MPKQTVLVIDDDEGVAEIIGKLLQAANFEPVIATDPEKGLALAQTAYAAAIICDVCMPRISGFAAMAALKHSAATSQIPVILTSGYNQTNFGMMKLAAAYLPKPFHPSELIAAVQGALSSPPDGFSQEPSAGENGGAAVCFAC